MWSSRILLKYTLLQVPEIAVLIMALMVVGKWIEIPTWVMWGLIGLWIGKDVALYPFVWRAYDWGSRAQKNPMIGLQGTANNRLDPSGYIFVRGELWKARVIEDGLLIEKGEHVIVKEVRGLTLMVEPETGKESRNP